MQPGFLLTTQRKRLSREVYNRVRQIQIGTDAVLTSSREKDALLSSELSNGLRDITSPAAHLAVETNAPELLLVDIFIVPLSFRRGCSWLVSMIALLHQGEVVNSRIRQPRCPIPYETFRLVEYEPATEHDDRTVDWSGDLFSVLATLVSGF